MSVWKLWRSAASAVALTLATVATAPAQPGPSVQPIRFKFLEGRTRAVNAERGDAAVVELHKRSRANTEVPDPVSLTTSNAGHLPMPGLPVTAVAAALAALSIGAVHHPPTADTLEAKVDAYVKPYLETGVFSGSVLVAHRGKVLLKKGYGMADYEHGVPNTPTTRFQVASISKLFTAIAIGVLEQQGVLSRSDLLQRFIPDFPGGDKITIEQLIRHRSGIVGDLTDFKSAQPLPAIIEQIKKAPLGYAPNTRAEYSNHGYRVLAYIIEQASRRSYGQFLHDEVLRPLGLRATGHAGPDTVLAGRARGYVPAGILGFVNAPFIDFTTKTGNGSLYSTVEDLHAWLQAIQDGRLLRKDLLAQLLPEDTRFKRRMLGASGGAPGFSARLEHYPDEDLTIILLMNNYATTAIPIVRDIGAMVLGEPYEVTRIERPVAVDPKTVASFAGTYQYGPEFFAANVQTVIGAQDGQLTVTSRGTTFALVAQSDTTFFDRFSWATITFRRDEQGRVSQFIWRYDGRDYPARRLNP